MCYRLLVCCVALIAFTSPAANFWQKLGLASRTNLNTATLAALNDDQVIQGLKEALAKGTEQAVKQLGRENGFLTNLAVRIPMPESMQKVERTLRTLKQDQLADSFVQTMNHAAEQAVPEAASILANLVRQMTLEDAKGILTGGTNAATQYFRRTSETNLYQKFLPIVKQATGAAGVTAAYKSMMDRASGGSSLISNFIKTQAPDLDDYVTRKSVDGLFLVIAEEEKRIRENPAARTTEMLQKVFGAVKGN